MTMLKQFRAWSHRLIAALASSCGRYGLVPVVGIA